MLMCFAVLSLFIAQNLNGVERKMVKGEELIVY